MRSASGVSALYDRLAPVYDLPAEILEVLGANALRRKAVSLLELHHGDTVVDLGCGSGFNLIALAEAVGPTGHVIGVDLSTGMLRRARARADRGGLPNVTLVHSDMRDYEVPKGVAAVLATFSLEMVPEHDVVVGVVAKRLAAVDGRAAVLGLRRPADWPGWAISLGRIATTLFGVTSAYEGIKPWHSVQRHFARVELHTALAGSVYLAVGRTA